MLNFYILDKYVFKVYNKIDRFEWGSVKTNLISHE